MTDAKNLDAENIEANLARDIEKSVMDKLQPLAGAKKPARLLENSSLKTQNTGAKPPLAAASQRWIDENFDFSK